MKQICK